MSSLSEDNEFDMLLASTDISEIDHQMVLPQAVSELTEGDEPLRRDTT